MEVWNPILWEFSRVMRECHRKVGAMLGKDRPPVSNGPIMGALRAQDGLTQEELSQRLQRNETSVALALERLVQEGYVTLEGEEGKSALHLTTGGRSGPTAGYASQRDGRRVCLQRSAGVAADVHAETPSAGGGFRRYPVRAGRAHPAFFHSQ